MKSYVIDMFREARDFNTVTKVVWARCRPFGPVPGFRLIHNRGVSRVACYIELESPKQQPALARALGTSTLYGAVCLDVPVRKDFGIPGKVIVLAIPATGVEPQLPQQPAARAANRQASA